MNDTCTTHRSRVPRRSFGRVKWGVTTVEDERGPGLDFNLCFVCGSRPWGAAAFLLCLFILLLNHYIGAETWDQCNAVDIYGKKEAGTGEHLRHFNNKINKHNRKAAAPHGRLPHTKHKLKSRPGPLSSSTVVTPHLTLPKLLRGTRDRWVVQVSFITNYSTGLAPFPRLSAPPHSSHGLFYIWFWNSSTSSCLCHLTLLVCVTSLFLLVISLHVINEIWSVM